MRAPTRLVTDDHGTQGLYRRCSECGPDDDPRPDGEGGFYLLRCRLGHEWWSRAIARSGSSPGEWERPVCPVCGREGASEEE
jgi:hypothetical protein